MRQTGVKDAVGSADVADVPIPTRCPSCGAALPVAAAWCSLCHSDLRPRTVTPSTSVVLPGTPTVTPVPTAAAVVPDASGGSTITDEPRPSGRHSAERVSQSVTSEPSYAGSAGWDDPGAGLVPGARGVARGGRAAARATARGKHAAGGRTAPSVQDLASLDPITIATSEKVTPEEVDAIADQMLSRLAILEERPRLLDPDDLPGGKWGFIGGGMLAVIVVVLAVGSLLVLITNR